MENSGASLRLVYAHRDDGIQGDGTRWEPRRVFCTEDPEHKVREVPYVVKYRRRDPDSAAALISEAVCHALLRALQVRTLDAALVRVDQALVRSYEQDRSLTYAISTGLHFGTVYRSDFQPAEAKKWPREFWNQLAEPRELAEIWVADCWFMNLDRGVYGNILLQPGRRGKWHLVAADQSDCFLGSGALADGSCFRRSRTTGPADHLPLLGECFYSLSCGPLHEMIRRIQNAAPLVPQACRAIPDQWWIQAGVQREALVQCLQERANRIREIVQVDYWEEMNNATKGGRSLGL